MGPNVFFCYFFRGRGMFGEAYFRNLSELFLFLFFIQVVIFSPYQNIFVEYSFRNIIVQV